MANQFHRKPFEPATADESLKGIKELMTKSGCTDYRKDAVVSGLRSVINRFGYRPRETKENPATPEELVEQVKECFKAGPAPEQFEFEIQMHLHSVHSNLKADAGIHAVPELKEVPKS